MTTDGVAPAPPVTGPAGTAGPVPVREGSEPGAIADAGLAASPGELTLPLHAEQVVVARRRTERPVQVHIRTTSREHPVDEPVTHERVEVERVAIGRPVDAVPPDREEGDTTVVSVVEEVVVVHRQLILKEEIRMRRVRVIGHHRETVSLREQQAVVERHDPRPQGDSALAALPASLQSPSPKDGTP